MKLCLLVLLLNLIICAFDAKFLWLYCGIHLLTKRNGAISTLFSFLISGFVPVLLVYCYMVDILAKIVRNKIFIMNKNYYSILFNHQRNQNLMYMKVFKRSCE